MKPTTIIHSNGSKWGGEEQDTIDRLIEVLATETIEERFFSTYRVQQEDKTYKELNLCPIDNDEEHKGLTRFFGNFEALSHVFRIDTNDIAIIERLTKAIKANKGWELYYNKNLVK